jgi:hypothetical protein
MVPAKEAVKALAKEKMLVTGCAGRAKDVR